MPSTYSTLKIQLMGVGENTTTWGNVANLNFEALEDAIQDSASVTFASDNQTVTLTDTNAAQTARAMRLFATGTTGGSTRNLIVDAIEKPYLVYNNCADSILVKTSAGTGVTVPAGKQTWVYVDGTNVVDAITHLSSLTLGTVLAVAQGGTGANSASAARTALGAAASGSNTDLTSITPSGGIVFGSPTGGAQGTGSINAQAIYVNGAAVGVGSGSVSSVNVSGGSTGLTFSGGPVTTTGTISMAGTLDEAYGGTGETSYTNGQLLIGNSTSGKLTKAELTAGAGVSITPGAGSITISATGASGTVTSVAADGGSTGFTFTGTPITTSGTLTLAISSATTARSALSAAKSGANTDITQLGGINIGSAAAPAIYSTSDTNTGVFWDASDGFGISAGGTQVALFNSSAATMAIPVTASVGSVSAPGFAFTTDTNTGMYRYSSDVLGFACGGSVGLLIGDSGGLQVVQTGGQFYSTYSQGLRLSSSNTPASASAAGNTGTICWDSSYIYVCVSSSTWKRAALSTW